MLALKKINNNFVLCQDEAGEEIVAMGKGLGFGELPREISIKEVERTFYDVDERYLSSVQSIPQDVMSLAVKICDIARKTLPYQVSPNLTFTMADHIEFILERVTNIAMGADINAVVEFEELAERGEDAPTATLAALLD